MLWHARDLEIAARPRQGSRIQGAGHRRTPRGLDVVMEKIVQREQGDPASNGREMIDDFRLRRSRMWRRMGDTATKVEVAHVGGARFGPPQICTLRG